jgi:ribonuclease-3
MTATETDYKSRLIEWCQKNRHSIKFDTRPAGDSVSQSPKFCSVAVIAGMEMGYGFGTTKKEAEQSAAYSVSQYTS